MALGRRTDQSGAEGEELQVPSLPHNNTAPGIGGGIPGCGRGRPRRQRVPVVVVLMGKSGKLRSGVAGKVKRRKGQQQRPQPGGEETPGGARSRFFSRSSGEREGEGGDYHYF